MSNRSEPIVDELFTAAAALAPALRSEFLESRCEGDTALRAELEALLECHDAAGDFLEMPPITSLPDPSVPLVREPETVPERIGAFHIERVLGVGGMGRVYLARTEHPRRQVALKVLRSGMRSHSLQRRFAQEAQVVALLQHPGIAQLYEAGTAQTPDGACPYFAMEYVDGPSLTGFARQRTLSTPQRLDLLCRVCDAVEHAHQRGVVHRDLKPGNILVDAAGQPRILDFGVARLSGQDAMTTLHTHAGQLIGTLSYMSPEQVSGDPGQVDARSDVYALGVILFELLTGKLPHDVISRTIPDAIRVIREDPPSALSTIDRTYRGDIETIVGKALEKDQARRYQSAAALAADIRRSLRDEPIVARRPSTWYQLAKFTKRNKAIVAGTAAAFLALAVGLVVAVWQARAADVARASADEALKTAKENLETTNETNRFLELLFSSPDPNMRMGKDVTVIQLLDRSARELDEELTRPHVKAALHRTIGSTYKSLSDYANAEPHLRAAYRIHLDLYGPEHAETLWSMRNLYVMLDEGGKTQEALELCRQAWAIVQPRPANDPDRVTVASNLSQMLTDEGEWADAVQLQRYVVAQREATGGPNDTAVLQSRQNLARALAHSDGLPEAIAIGRENRRRFREAGHEMDAAAFRMFVAMGNDLVEDRDMEEAETLCAELLEQGRTMFTDDHPVMLTFWNLQAQVYLHLKRFDEAEAIYRRIIPEHRRNQVPAVDGLVRVLNNFGSVYHDQERWAEAEAAYREALQVLDEHDPRPRKLRLSVLNNLVTSIRMQKKHREALPIYKDLVETAQATLAAGDWELAAMKYGYAICLAMTADPQNPEPHALEAEKQLKEAYEIATKALKEDDERVITVMRSLYDLYHVWGKTDKAEYWHAKLPEKYRGQ